MDLDFSEFFAQYEQLAAETDKVFAHVKNACPDQVTCHEGCSGCCHALFDVSLIEGMYLNHHFKKAFPDGAERDKIALEANRSDRDHYRLKKSAFKASQEGMPSGEILEMLARAKIRCPLLDENDRCRMYDKRPITCRVYGAPLEIGGKAMTCEKTGFTPGEKYPTVKVEAIQDKLMILSQKLVDTLPTRHVALATVLAPVSMVLLTEYDEEFLGLPKKDGEDKPGTKGCSDPSCSCATPGEADECKNCDSLLIRDIGVQAD